jgi:plastocyanin
MKTKITFLFTLLFVTVMMSTVKATIHTVQVANYSFTPSTLSIKSGDTVKWVWVSGSHTTTSTSVPSGAATWDNPINSTSTQFQIQLTVVGTYNYYCMMHPSSMLGTITVTSATGLTNYNNNSYHVSAFPNPFSDKVSISFSLPEKGTTTLSIYDMTGKLVRMLVNTDYEKGDHVISWDGRNENGDCVNHGLYFYMIESKGQTKVSGKIIYGS